MRFILLISITWVLSACANRGSSNSERHFMPHQEVSFYTQDSLNIIADLYVQDKTDPIILLFHQGGSNARGEYGPIIPRLLQKGFNVLATDQRVGGQWYGSYNRTLAAIKDHQYDDGYTYCDAFSNLEAALDYVNLEGFGGKKIVWGSSYSASLAIKLASARPKEIDGLLAFSPASSEAMEGCIPTQYLESLSVPTLLLRPPSEMELDRVQKQMKLASTLGHQTYVAKYGVHGASMLVQERVGHPVEETWSVVWSFLSQFK